MNRLFFFFFSRLVNSLKVENNYLSSLVSGKVSFDGKEQRIWRFSPWPFGIACCFCCCCYTSLNTAPFFASHSVVMIGHQGQTKTGGGSRKQEKFRLYKFHGDQKKADDFNYRLSSFSTDITGLCCCFACIHLIASGHYMIVYFWTEWAHMCCCRCLHRNGGWLAF